MRFGEAQWTRRRTAESMDTDDAGRRAKEKMVCARGGLQDERPLRAGDLRRRPETTFSLKPIVPNGIYLRASRLPPPAFRPPNRRFPSSLNANPDDG